MEAGWKTKVVGEKCNDHGIKQVLFAEPDLSQEPIFYRGVGNYEHFISHQKRYIDYMYFREINMNQNKPLQYILRRV